MAFAAGLAAACGARTGLYAPRDASTEEDDASHVSDAFPDIVFEAPDIGDANVLTCEQAGANKGTVGCDFIVPTPSFYTGIAPPCWAVFVANDGSFPVHIAVDRGATAYDVTKFGRIAQTGTPETTWPSVPSTGLPAGEVAVLFMEQDPASASGNPMTCPVTPAVSQPYGTALPGSGTLTSLTGIGTAWHIATDLPVQMFDILPYGGAKTFLPSAELLIPTASLGTNYFGIVPQRGTSTPQWAQIVATQNGTAITLFPSVPLPSGNGVPFAPANTLTTFNGV